ncbi:MULTISPECIES: Imm8 family immunity protein [Saccharibacillus]|uniref:Imm8 family immunity protein n=1 Tax=Saccharibacillus TaxID=456492 RepID=UPI00123B95AF|nr:Imm8 family immunity protein [Saccharibacillus sp. WB 17]MWJ31376.1 hypothetical protein [Saccharibacillus sp. WB 17]
MIEVELKDIHVFNEPDSATNFCLAAILYIGLKGEEGADAFHAIIVSPKGLYDSLKNEKNTVLRNYILLQEYDLKELERLVTEIVEISGRETWKQTALFLNKFFSWNYEDYGLDPDHLDLDQLDPRYRD